MWEKGAGSWSPAKVVKQKLDDYANQTANQTATVARRGWIPRPLKYIALLVVILSMFYAYLTSMYFIDEIYDGATLRELELVEKYTIRVVGSSGLEAEEALGKFVSKYSLCQQVEEVQILWSGSAETAPKENSFVYPHTHSRVTITGVTVALGEAERAALIMTAAPAALRTATATEAILLLDLRAQVECHDLAFAHSVWRSSRQALVGFSPWLHRQVNPTGRGEAGDAGGQYAVYDWKFVWWNQAYSLMHAAALFVEKGLLDKLAEHAGVREVLQKKPECFEFALSVLSAKEKPRSAPMWVNVPARCPSCYDSQRLERPDARGQCLAALASAVAVGPLPYSTHKTSRANTFWLWSS